MNNIGSYSIIMWLINNESKEKRKRTIETAQYRLDITFNLETEDYIQQTSGQIKMTRTMTRMIKKSKSKSK